MLVFPYMTVPGPVARRPVVMLAAEGPAANRLAVDVLVDTGADRILLAKFFADQLGVNLTDQPVGTTRSITGEVLPFFEGQVVLELRAPPAVVVRWTARVAFVEQSARPLFGRLGGLEYFHAHFLGPEHRLILEPQSNLPVAP